VKINLKYKPLQTIKNCLKVSPLAALFMVVVIGAIGLSVVKSNCATVSAASGDTSPPTKPTNFIGTLNHDHTAVNLSWGAATDDVGVMSYLIERSTDAITWSMLSQSADQTTLTDPSLPSDAGFYYYRIRAQDAAGNQSETAFADIENIATSAENTNQATAAPTTSDSNIQKVLEAVGGGVLIIGAVGGGFAWYRWRTARYGQPAVSIAPFPITSAAPHQSKSLKEMVMESYPAVINKPSNVADPKDIPDTPKIIKKNTLPEIQHAKSRLQTNKKSKPRLTVKSQPAEVSAAKHDSGSSDGPIETLDNITEGEIPLHGANKQGIITTHDTNPPVRKATKAD
jgi:hypothetical protein